MKINFKIMLFVIFVFVFTIAAASFANDPVKIMINRLEIGSGIPAAVIDGKTMIPVRNIAEIFNLEVQWDEKERAVNIIAPGHVSSEFVAALIKKQGKSDGYYFDGLYYEAINIDEDDDLEILARIDGGTNIGQFFIFDLSDNGKYTLVTEKKWKVEGWNIDTGCDVEGKNLFELTTRDGGTGISVIYAHLWYLDNGEYVEVWQNTLEESSSFADEYYLKMGGYRVARDDKTLYYWQTEQSYHIQQIEGNNYDFIPRGSEKNTALKYQFTDGKYVL